MCYGCFHEEDTVCSQHVSGRRYPYRSGDRYTMLFLSAPRILPFSRYELMPPGGKIAYCLGADERISPAEVLKSPDCKEKPAVRVFRFDQRLGVSPFFSIQPAGLVRGGKGCDRCGGASASPSEAKGSAALKRRRAFGVGVERQFLPAPVGQKLRSTARGCLDEPCLSSCVSPPPPSAGWWLRTTTMLSDGFVQLWCAPAAPLQGGAVRTEKQLSATPAPAFNSCAQPPQVIVEVTPATPATTAGGLRTTYLV